MFLINVLISQKKKKPQSVGQSVESIVQEEEEVRRGTANQTAEQHRLNGD